MPEKGFTPDWRRQERLGFDEAIFCQSKTVEHLGAILADAEEKNHTLLLTRLQPSQYAGLQARYGPRLDFEELSRTAFFGEVEKAQTKPRVAVVTAGTSDIAVAREAVRTLNYYAVNCAEIYDVGVAGLWRLLERVEEIRDFPVVLAIAGMDAALPSVLGGLVPGVVIAVPTATGYGVAADGHSALNAVLASCAPGVVVVNIDNGYGAACAALRVLNT